MNLASPEMLSGQMLWHCGRIGYLADLAISIYIPGPTEFLEIPPKIRRQEVYKCRNDFMEEVYSLRDHGFSAIALQISQPDGIHALLAPTPTIGKPSSFVFHPQEISTREGRIKVRVDLYTLPGKKFHTFDLADVRQIYLFPSLL